MTAAATTSLDDATASYAADPLTPAGADPPTSADGADGTHSVAFWVIISVLCLTTLVSSLDALIITTALPHVTDAIGGQERYVWIANSFVLASTVVQPLYAQLSNIFGRRNPMLFALTLFSLGSGIAGGARNVPTLIAGRSIQGLGSAGLFVLSDLIVCDLVPLRDRAKYLGIVISTGAIGTTLGPIVGGALAQADWRWCFYFNLPLAIPCLGAMAYFLRLKHQREPTWKSALARVDFIGALIFIPSITALLLGLIMGGQVYPWSSWRVILPIVLGALGWIAFHIHQASPICKEPSIPPRLFQNRTSATGFVLCFTSNLLLNWAAYFLPFYFQAVKTVSPLLSGVYVLPFNLFLVPSAMVSGVLLSKLGQYKPIHWVGFGFLSVGCGLLSTLDTASHTAAWVCFQSIMAIGLGFVMTSILPAICAPLTEEDVGTANGTFSFLRSFGFIWGITLPSIIFNDRFNHYALRIEDTALRSQLMNGAAYGYANSGLMRSLTGALRGEVISVYTGALKSVWQASIGFAVFSFALVFVEKHVSMRTELDTKFGLEDKAPASGPQKDVGKTAREE
ncbi:MFS general substrate transporter [Lentithecium fluviatile CBS 122367]|uniref:MFS general substrate transporter n=1 Tax=Lentithecium fluviatile CBS 122367 TaxID=1168545 RepID=A0A6G1ICC8_9PLEO|nr:MFS general substrate transporter [Lentithecium fluviatile CBS 122367]